MPVGYDVVPLSYRCTRAPGFHPQNSGQSRSRIFCTNLAWDHRMADTIGATGCTICKRCLFARLLEQIQTIWEAKLFGSKTTSLLQRISFETIPNIRESPIWRGTRSLCDAIDGRFGIQYNTSTMITAMRRDGENQKDEGSMEVSEELRAAKKPWPRCRGKTARCWNLGGKRWTYYICSNYSIQYQRSWTVKA